jgi:hypothetical protein
MRILGRVIDERFLEHRRRSTSFAGMAASALSLVLFEYHVLAEHLFRWELLSIGLTFAVVKLAFMIYYIRHD